MRFDTLLVLLYLGLIVGPAGVVLAYDRRGEFLRWMTSWTTQRLMGVLTIMVLLLGTHTGVTLLHHLYPMESQVRVLPLTATFSTRDGLPVALRATLVIPEGTDPDVVTHEVLRLMNLRVGTQTAEDLRYSPYVLRDIPGVVVSTITFPRTTER